MNKKNKNILRAILMYSILAVMFIIIIYPLLWTLGLSLNSGSNLYGSSMIPKDASLKTIYFY